MYTALYLTINKEMQESKYYLCVYQQANLIYYVSLKNSVMFFKLIFKMCFNLLITYSKSTILYNTLAIC